MLTADKDSPRQDHNGRDLFEVVLFDGYKKIKVYYYGYTSQAAVGYAQSEHGLRWKSVQKMTEKDKW